MPYQNTRDPYDLNDHNYGEYCVKLKDFLAEPNSLPHRPNHMVAEQIARADAFIAALDEFIVAETLSQNASKVVKAAVDGIESKLLWFKYILPTVIIGPDTLVEEFGLDGEMPVEYAKIKNKGDEVWAIWEIRKVEPMFAFMLADGDLLQGLLTAYDNAVSAQNTAHNVYSTKSVAKNEAREAHHFISQEIFNHYRAYYPNAQDDYWIKTPWGKAGGGGGGEPGGEVPEIPNAPEGVYANFSTTPVIHILVGCGEYGEHSGFDVRKATTPAGVTTPPPMPDSNLGTNIPVDTEPLMDTDIEKGNRYWYWVRARNGVEVGDWSEVVWAEYI